MLQGIIFYKLHQTSFNDLRVAGVIGLVPNSVQTLNLNCLVLACATMWQKHLIYSIIASKYSSFTSA